MKKNDNQSDEVQKLMHGIAHRDYRVLGKAITLVESERDQDFNLQIALLRALKDFSKGKNPTIRIAITGTPGVGKSSFIDTLCALMLEEDPNLHIGVFTIDPSSPVRGGSILGDKTRMEKIGVDPRVYIRPSPSGTAPGGMSPRAHDVMTVMSSAGFDFIFVETVGVGQTEFTAYQLADVFILLHQPGSGDELQGIKKGILELSDLIAIHKADGDLKHVAELAASQLRSALSYTKKTDLNRFYVTSIHDEESLVKFKSGLLEFVENQKAMGLFSSRRDQQSAYWIQEGVMNAIRTRLEKNKKFHNAILSEAEKVACGEQTTIDAVEKILTKFIVYHV